MIDQDFSQAVWTGSIRTEFCLADSDNTSLIVPPIFHALVSRISYLPVIAHEIGAVDCFRSFVVDVDSSNEIWFEYNGKPLKCNIPVGVLFDLFVPNGIDAWDICIRFGKFPSTEVLRCCTPETCRRYFKHSLKQSVSVLHGSVHKVADLEISKQNNIWTSSCAGNLIEYEAVIQELRPVIPSKFIPVRVLLKGCTIIQRPVPSIVSSMALEEIAATSKVNGNLREEGPGRATSRAACIQDVLEICLSKQSEVTNHDIFIHGIRVLPSAPLWDVWRLMSHGDLFLYIVVVSLD